MKYTNLNSFQRHALIDLHESCYEARPFAKWVQVWGGYRWRDLYTLECVDSYVANNEPLAHED